MHKKALLITGAAGEVGTALVERLAAAGQHQLLTIDVRSLPEVIAGTSVHHVGDILDHDLFARLVAEFEFERI